MPLGFLNHCNKMSLVARWSIRIMGVVFFTTVALKGPSCFNVWDLQAVCMWDTITTRRRRHHHHSSERRTTLSTLSYMSPNLQCHLGVGFIYVFKHLDRHLGFTASEFPTLLKLLAFIPENLLLKTVLFLLQQKKDTNYINWRKPCQTKITFFSFYVVWYLM